MENLRISLLQTDLVWHDAESNRQNITEKLRAIVPNTTDVLVLPEMFTSGFTMKAKEVAETMQGKTMQAMATWAKQINAAVCGSLVIKDNEQYYNRLVWMLPNGTYQFYDKKHLFRMANEHKVYQAGHKKIIVRYKGWRLCLMVCYDLRFPVWSRNRFDKTNETYDCLVYVANWPAIRSYAWQQLLKARAIENLSYVVGLNRVGLDAKNINYSGNSLVANYKGELLWTNDGENILATTEIIKQDLIDYRNSFPAWQDADAFNWV